MMVKVVEMIMVTRVVTVCYDGEISGVLVMMTGVMVCYGGDGVYDDNGGDGVYDDDGCDGMLW